MDAREIAKLMKQFDDSNLKELRIARGSSSVYFSKLNQPGAMAGPSRTASPQKRVPAAHQKPAANKSKPTKTVQHLTGKTIQAPLVGIVYFAPSAKKPAFAKVGSHVNKGDVVCQIEAMKVLNDVKAPVSGTIEKRLVKNGSMVQYHQPIFAIKED